VITVHSVYSITLQDNLEDPDADAFHLVRQAQAIPSQAKRSRSALLHAVVLWFGYSTVCR
jgi:hypothetical protein